MVAYGRLIKPHVLDAAADGQPPLLAAAPVAGGGAGGAGHPGRRRGDRRVPHGPGGGARHRPGLRLRASIAIGADETADELRAALSADGHRAAACGSSTTACPSPGPRRASRPTRPSSSPSEHHLDWSRPAERAPPGRAPGPGVDDVPGPAAAGPPGPAGAPVEGRTWPRASSTRPPSRSAPATAGRWRWSRCSPRARPASRPPPGATAPASSPASASDLTGRSGAVDAPDGVGTAAGVRDVPRTIVGVILAGQGAHRLRRRGRRHPGGPVGRGPRRAARRRPATRWSTAGRWPTAPTSVADALRRLTDGFAGLVVTTGGTGFGPRDLTPEGTPAGARARGAGPGRGHAAGQPATRAGCPGGWPAPWATALVLNTPGSTAGAVECLEAVLDVLPHALDLLAGRAHRPSGVTRRDDDEAAMGRAIELAAGVRTSTSPNPWVGCVIEPGRVRGRHPAAGRAPRRDRGPATPPATRPGAPPSTPPSSRAPTPAAPRRASTPSSPPASPGWSSASRTPTPRCAGAGIAALRAAGVEVDVGRRRRRGAGPARPLPQAPHHGRPWVVLKLAATLDGRTAAPDGSSRWITGEAARADAHRLRAESDAVIVGAGTVRADDPVAHRAPRRPGSDPLRVVLGHAPAGRQGPPRPRAGGRPRARPRRARAAAASSRPWSRAGATVAGDFHRAGLVDRYVLYLAPALLGGDDGRPLLAGPGAATIADVWRGRIVVGRPAWATTCGSSWSRRVHRPDRGAGPPRAAGTATGSRFAAADRPRATPSVGDSIAVNGCCLTVVDLGAGTWSADVVDETLRPHQPGRPPAGRPGQPRAAGAARRTASAATSCRATSTPWARSSRPAPDLRRRARPTPATWSRRGRSRSTGSASPWSTLTDDGFTRGRHPPHGRGHHARGPPARATG